ncbi:MAG: hypothetical protein HN350_20810 [Phycisphaerales bacterium]|nr:hypothetical protein [Phycisphaerales bacterium]
MADVKCKRCGRPVEIEQAYHAEAKGFYCDSCHSHRVTTQILMVAAILVVGVPLVLLLQMTSSPPEEPDRVQGFTLNSGGTFSIAPVDWPSDDAQDKPLHDNWEELLINKRVLDILQAGPADMTGTYSIDYYLGLPAIVEVSEEKKVVMLLLDKSTNQAFRLIQKP